LSFKYIIRSSTNFIIKNSISAVYSYDSTHRFCLVISLIHLKIYILFQNILFNNKYSNNLCQWCGLSAIQIIFRCPRLRKRKTKGNSEMINSMVYWMFFFSPLMVHNPSILEYFILNTYAINSWISDIILKIDTESLLV
jgi:hypothetical protein